MTMDSAPGAVDPSMEDILASIRRILNEEEVKPPEAEAAETKATIDPPDVQNPAVPHPAQTDPGILESDILELDHSMMVSAPAAPEAPPIPHVAMAPTPMNDTHTPTLDAPNLVAPETAAAAASSVGTLLQTLSRERSTAVSRGGPTIEDLVREEVRPMLKDWLDTHLPPVVERLVRAEIERVINRTG